MSTRLDILPFLLTCVRKLEDLYVKPEHRAHGIGKAFFGALGKIAQEKVGMCPHSFNLVLSANNTH